MNALCHDLCLAYLVLERTSANELFEIRILLAHLKDKLQLIRDIEDDQQLTSLDQPSQVHVNPWGYLKKSP
jgi:hypothetical protein